MADEVVDKIEIEIVLKVEEPVAVEVEIVDEVVHKVEAEDEAETMENIQRFLELSSPILVRNSGF